MNHKDNVKTGDLVCILDSSRDIGLIVKTITSTEAKVLFIKKEIPFMPEGDFYKILAFRHNRKTKKNINFYERHEFEKI